MSQNIFEFRDYKDLIRAQAKRSGRGFKKLLAEAAQVQTTYISQVLGGEAHLSLEQAQAACPFLGLNRDESYFFLLLVQRARAGTVGLAQFLDDKIKQEQERNLLIQDRVKLKSALGEEAKAEYFSSWHYAAIHMLITIPQFQSPVEIAKRLRLPMAKVNNILQFLVSVGLVKKTDEKFLPGESQLYLEKSSPLISKHHTNWRMRAIDSLDRNAANDLHFSSAFTLTEEAAIQIRQILVQAIEDSVNVVKPAKEEQLMVMAIDLFDL